MSLVRTFLLTALLALHAPCLNAGNSGSDRSSGVPASGKQAYIDPSASATKAGEGIKNLLFGWTDVPKSIAETTRESGNPLWGLTGGTLKGVGKAFPRTVSGITEVLTSPACSSDSDAVRPDKLNEHLR